MTSRKSDPRYRTSKAISRLWEEYDSPRDRKVLAAASKAYIAWFAVMMDSTPYKIAGWTLEDYLEVDWSTELTSEPPSTS